MFSSLRGNDKVIDEAISGVCCYFMRLPRSLWLAMTIWCPRINAK
ncbi:hypothetical protein RAMDARK_1578 [Rickettsia amblyommatis str. Darkwater]|uniref:Uncharacterized protein n=1 Tax=Rickettsia amblyommatis str. Ac/Pa TaxID=1359164 RepID=A0A0F3MZL7_RICAM|nr:hypothetical protein APHACPA_0122 [Rickettsia amblyommatis str. Ac/Pa]KJV88878.1 hypothetical protein RAMDARK_1578 [Rickettsia amblyommatis str. Darkwater]